MDRRKSCASRLRANKPESEYADLFGAEGRANERDQVNCWASFANLTRNAHNNIKGRFLGVFTRLSELSKQQSISLWANGFITANAEKAQITNEGLKNWDKSSTVISIFFWMTKAEPVEASLRLRIVESTQSKIRLALTSVNGQAVSGKSSERDITAQGGQYHVVQFGLFNIEVKGEQNPRGFYVRFDLTGVSTTGQIYAEVTDLIIQHEDGNNQIVFNQVKDAYFGRRGPSVSLGYRIGDNVSESTEYFYTEVEVPSGSDYDGLYAMAIGFTGGYFGIQVNNPPERRVLFSIFSDYNTNNPGEVPADYRIQLVRRGENTVVQDFGGEGSGAQSFIRYGWSPGVKYQFLVHALPHISENSTQFTAWFKRPDSNTWTLVASFRKPMVKLYLKNLYSFLENFMPQTGHIERTARYGNQWACDANGQWSEVLRAEFNVDETAKLGRRDYDGGIDPSSTRFQLRHCGFFSNNTPFNQLFLRMTGGNRPEIDFKSLP